MGMDNLHLGKKKSSRFVNIDEWIHTLSSNTFLFFFDTLDTLLDTLLFMIINDIMIYHSFC